MKNMKKRILSALLSLSMIASAWVPAGPVLKADAATTTKLVNVALDARSALTDDNVDITNVVDGSEESTWVISGVREKTAIIELQGGRNVSRLNLKLKGGDTSSKNVKITVKYAQNGVVSDLIAFGSSTYTLTGDDTITMSAATPVSATHFYVTLSTPDGSAADTTLELSVSEIEIYETQNVFLSNYSNIARQATITTDGNKGTTEAPNLVDGSNSTVYGFHKILEDDRSVTLTFPEERSMDAVRIAFESTGSVDSSDYQYTYSIHARNGEGEYTPIVENAKGNRTDLWQESYKFAAAVYTEVKITMHGEKCSSNLSRDNNKIWPGIAEFEIYGSQPPVTDEGNIAIQKPVHAASGKGSAVNVTDGHTNTVWTGDYYPAYVDINLEENYNLETIEVYTPTNGYSQYSIYTSMDGRNFDKLAEKTSTVSATDAGESYDANDREARIVRIFMEYNSAQAAPILNEVRVMGTPSGTAVVKRPAINVQKYADTAYATKTITNDDTYAEVYGIIERRLGAAYKEWFSLELGANPDGSDYDYFELSMVNGKVHVKGNDGVSLATGINHYLKYYCNVNISQVGDQAKMPETMPQVTGTVHKETKAKVRYAYNYCTLSYSMAFWGEPEWRNELDWLALNGVNVVLDATAQEEVWRRFLGKLGYSHEDAKDYIAGPAYYAWAYMANLSGFGGPVHDSWFEDRTELARKNQQIMRTLGMEPVLQGYSGMVPTDIRNYDPNAEIIGQGGWCSFQRPAMLVTTSAKFDEYAALFYESQKEVYGDVSDYYATDPFHEGGNPGSMSMSDVSEEVLKSMLQADKDGIWIIQAWQGNPTTALLNGLDRIENGAQHALVLDLYAEKDPHNQQTGGAYGDEKEFDATPWVYCMLNNFGGRLGLHGHLDNLANNIPAAFNNNQCIAGIGIAPEASVNNPVLYDFFFETIWQEDASQKIGVIDLNTWLDDYAERRYGASSQSANQAWDILKETVYKASLNMLGQGAPESVVNARPATEIGAASAWGNAVVSYDKVKLEEAALLLLEDYDTLKSSEGYMYDVANVLQQVLSNSAQEYHKRMVAAYQAREIDNFKTYSEKFLEIVTYMEKVTATSEYFLLGRWVEQAKALADSAVKAGDDFTVELYEINAKALVTTWGSINQCETGKLRDYSNRQWSGLIGDFYKPRWERWITARTNELEGNSYESSINWFQWEWEWVRDNETYTTTPTPQDLETLGREIIEKFTSTDPNADPSRDVDVNKITITDGNHQTGKETEGAAADFVQDNQTNTLWHTLYDGSARDTHYIEFTFDEPTAIDGMRFLQRQSGTNGVVTKFDLYVKTTGSNEWQLLVDDGILTTDRSWQIINLPETEVSAVKFQVVDSMSDNSKIFSAAAEIRFTKPAEDKPDTPDEVVEVEAGDTIEIVKTGNFPLTADMVKLDTNKAKVTVTNTYVQDVAANTYLSSDKTYSNTPIWLSKCLHTFTLKDDGTYEITGIAEDGKTTVYVNPRVPGRVGFPHTTEAESIQVVPQTGGGYKLVDNSQQDYWLTYKSAWNVFNEDERNASDATTVFHLYKQAANVDENGNTIYTYEKANDLGASTASYGLKRTTGQAEENQYVIVAELGNGDKYVLRPSNDTNKDQDGIGRNSHVAKMSDGNLKEYTSVIEIEGVTPGTTTYVTVGGTEYEINVTAPEETLIPTETVPVSVKVDGTVVIKKESDAPLATDFTKLDTTKATVDVTSTYVQDAAANTHLSNGNYVNTPIELGDCLYTFTLKDDGTYEITGIAEDGTTTVYMNPRVDGRVGYPNTIEAESIQVVAQNNGGFKFIDNSQPEKCLTFSVWKVFNEDEDANEIETQIFQLYRQIATTDAQGNTVYTYEKTNDFVNGEKYVIVAEVSETDKFVLRPSTDLNTASDGIGRNSHVVKWADDTLKTYTNVITITGVSEGTTSAIVGTTQYNINVEGVEVVEKEVTVKLGDKLKIFDQSGTFTEDGFAGLDKTVANVTVEARTINDLKAKLYDGSAYEGEQILLNSCLYTFNQNADGTFTISATLADGTVVYVNPRTPGKIGYPNTTTEESIIVETTGNGTFKLTDATEDDFYLSLSQHKVFNEEETAGGVGAFELYELKETAEGSGIYEYHPATTVVDGGQYAIVAKVSETEKYILCPSNNQTDGSGRNSHVAKLTDTVETVTGNAITIEGLKIGDTSMTVGNTDYTIHVVGGVQRIKLEVGESIVLPGTNVTKHPDETIVSMGKSEDGYEITGVDAGKATVVIDGITYHITVEETQVASVIGTSNGKEVKRLTLSANNSFNLDIINSESGNVTWSVIDKKTGTAATWATISADGVISATNPAEHDKTFEGYIVAVVDGVEYKTELKISPAPTSTSLRLYDIYIDELYHTDLYYGWIYGYGEANQPQYGSTKLVEAISGEVIYVSMGTEYENALDFFAKPKEGYALTQMGATGSDEHYMRLQGKTPEETEFITESGVAGHGQYHKYDREATANLVQQAMDLGCHGAQGFSRDAGHGSVSSILSYHSEKLPTVSKSVLGIGTGDNYRPYGEGAKAEIGEYVYFKVTVDTYPIIGEYVTKNGTKIGDKDILYYTNELGERIEYREDGNYPEYIKLTDMLQDAVFISEDEIGKVTSIDANAKSTLNITKDILHEEQVGQTHDYYVVYQIKPEDVINIDMKLQNTVELDYDYGTHYSSGSFTGAALDSAEILITTLMLGNMVVDFGLPVVYEQETATAFNEGMVTTNYGSANIICEPIPNSEKYLLTVVFTPLKTFEGIDAIPLVETANGNVHMIAVYPASSVYYEEGFATYSENQWGNKISLGNGVQETQIIPTGNTQESAQEDATVHYGFDKKYAAEQAGPSNGTEAVSKTYGSLATFTFTGTGADVYANCQNGSNPTGALSILVKNGTKIEKLVIVDTKVAGDKNAASNVQNSITEAWNLPVASLKMEAHGTYTVSIRHTKTKAEADAAAAGNPVVYPVRLDGFKVYNTLEDQKVYEVHNEANPNFLEVRNAVLGAVNLSEVLNSTDENVASIYAEDIAKGLSQVYDSTEAAEGTFGNAYIIMNDTNKTTTDQLGTDSAKDLLDNGPKNELFLYPGESLVFGLAEGLKNVQVGLKAVNGALTATSGDAVVIEKTVQQVEEAPEPSPEPLPEPEKITLQPGAGAGSSVDTTESETYDKSEGSAIDGNPATFWASVPGGKLSDASYVITLDGIYNISQVDYTKRVHNGSYDCTGNLLDYVIEVSTDGDVWEQVADGNTVNGTTEIKFDVVTAKYVRLTANNSYHWDSGQSNTVMTVAELAVYGNKVEKITLQPGAGAGSSVDTTESETYDKSEGSAIDGNPATFWASVPGGKLSDASYVITLDGIYNISQVDYTKRVHNGSYDCTGNLLDYVIEVSTDGDVWEQVADGNTVNGTTEIKFDVVAAKYVRLTANNSYHWDSGQSNTVMTVAELAVYGAPATRSVQTTSATPVAVALADATPAPAYSLTSLTSSTDMFYLLGDAGVSEEGKKAVTTITITNNSDKVLSVTKLKYFAENPAAASEPFVALGREHFMAVALSMGFDTDAEKQPEEARKPVTEIFSDVKDTWYTEYIQYVYDNGIMSGVTGTDEFRPGTEVTKAQVAQVLYNMEGKPEVTDRTACTELKDVAVGSWYTDAVCWAYATGVVTGDTSTKEFYPNAAVTRQELAVMLYRYAEYKEYDTTKSSKLENLLNADQVSSWAEDGVKWAVGMNLISGMETADGYDLAPRGTASRAQMAAILARFCEANK